MKTNAPASMSREDREALEDMARGAAPSSRRARQSRGVLMMADGMLPGDVAARLKVSPSTVRSWRARYEALGLAGLFGNGVASKPATAAIVIRDPALRLLALTHRSYLHEHPEERRESNERLEFLGDAFLGLVIAEELFRRFPEEPEGRLTEMRSRLVRTETLAELGRALGVGEALYLGKGEERSGGRTRERNLARGLEAMAGALLLDQGHARARSAILRLFRPLLDGLSFEPMKDYKSLLQVEVQSRGGRSPVYVTVSAEGPDHTRQFTVEVRASDRLLGSGTGQSKRKAEQEAARAALAAISPS